MIKFIQITLVALVTSLLIGCHPVEKIMAENYEYKITSIEKDGHVTLHSYNKKTGQTQDILSTDPLSRMYAALDYENVSAVHKDSLLYIDKVTILWSPGETLLLALEDCADASNPNTHTFIFNEKSDSLTHLPSNAGLMGLTSEEGHLVVQSYEYYFDEIGGRYNTIDVYDVNGILISSISLKERR